MALDPSIILSGQAPNIIGAIDAGNIAGQRRNEFVRTNALNAFLQQNGPGVMAGDQNALAGLARFDPTAALGVQDQRQQMAARDQAMTMARQQARDQAQAQAAQMTAEQRAQEAAMLERVLAGASSFYAQGDQAGYTSWLQQNNLDPAQYPFEQFPAIAATAGDVLDTLKTFQDMNAPQGTNYVALGDPTMGLDPAQPYNYETGPDGMRVTPIGGGGTTINNNIPNPNDSGVTDKFYENLDTAQATMFGTLLEQGMSAPARLAQVDELDALLQASPSGAEAAIKQYLGSNLGIDTTGLSELQAAQALISRLVPAQRAPGSGPMSDADLALFKESLPRLINTPGGNQIISQTIRGLIVYEQRQAEIANRVASREITPAEGRSELMALDNPLRVANAAIGPTTIQGDWQEVAPGIRIRRVE